MITSRRLARRGCIRWPGILLGLAFLAFFTFLSTGAGQPLFSDNFDSLASPIIVTNSGTTNGYNLKFSAALGPEDFKAIFGFDYSAVTYPTNIPPAPHSSGTTKGLYLTVNKDSIAAVAAVNLYPVSQSFSGNFMLQFDLWMNYGRTSTTEHSLFGVNHSGQFTNQVTMQGSDGLFFAVSADGGCSASSASVRDFSVFQGGGTPLAPTLLTSANTVFGP